MSKSDKKAAALKYDPGQDIAPVVIASGYGTAAEQIINIAEKTGIPVYRDDSVSSMLCMLDVGKNIPSDLYEVISRVYCSILLTAEKYKGVTPDKNEHELNELTDAK